MLECKRDVVGGTYRKKSDAELYPIKACPPYVVDADGLMAVDGMGPGFMKMSAKALRYLWDACPPYTDNGIAKRWAFDVRVESGELVSEDIALCAQLRAGGFRVYLDTAVTCDHVGPHKWSGDFATWLRHVRVPPHAERPAPNHQNGSQANGTASRDD